MATASYFQLAASVLMPATIFLGVRIRPDGNFSGVFCPLARIFTVVPPTSTTSTRMRCLPDWPRVLDRERGALGCDHGHQRVPRLDERGSAVSLQPHGEGLQIHAGGSKLREHFLARAAVSPQETGEIAVIRKRVQGG